MAACLFLLCFFSFSILSQEIGWEERLRNDLFSVGWDKKNLNSINSCNSSSRYSTIWDVLTDRYHATLVYEVCGVDVVLREFCVVLRRGIFCC